MTLTWKDKYELEEGSVCTVNLDEFPTAEETQTLWRASKQTMELEITRRSESATVLELSFGITGGEQFFTTVFSFAELLEQWEKQYNYYGSSSATTSDKKRNSSYPVPPRRPSMTEMDR